MTSAWLPLGMQPKLVTVRAINKLASEQQEMGNRHSNLWSRSP